MPLDERPESVAEQTETADAAHVPSTTGNGTASGNGTAAGNGTVAANGTAAASTATASTATSGTTASGTTASGTTASGTTDTGTDGAAPADGAAGVSRRWLDRPTQLAFASFL